VTAAPVTGLILSGGGARAAYQVGVLAAIAELLPAGAANPFPVIVGTSAGAINAVSLASGAMDFTRAVEHLTAFWQGFESRRVLRSDWPGVLHQATRFLGHSLLGLGAHVPVAFARQLALALSVAGQKSIFPVSSRRLPSSICGPSPSRHLATRPVRR
jgi:NTE family protein